MELWLLFRQKQVRKRQEREKIQIMVPFHSFPTRNIKFQKNRKKIQKIKKILIWIIFEQKQVGKGREREKLKIIVPFGSYPMRNEKFKNNSKKIQKIKKNHTNFI